MKLREIVRFAVLAGACALSQPALAGPVAVSDAWVRWLPGDLPAAGYMTLKNETSKPVDLLSARSPDFGMVMLHESVSNGSTARMVDVDKLRIPAHGTVAIAPGGYHFMLENAKRKLTPGDKIKLELSFSDGAVLTVPMDVRPPTGAR